MKAAIINGFGEIPQFKDFPDPIPVNGEQLIQVKASVLENFDKGTASGKHYSSNTLFPQFPAVVGNDGVGILEDGTLVSFRNTRAPYGAFAEKTIAGHADPIPEGIDPAKAAAIPSSAMTCLLPMKYSAKLQPGETILINGATGVSGRIAVQIARMMGAGRIIGTGRNEKSLQFIRTLGADDVIDLKQSDEDLAQAFTKAGGENGIDVVVDFIWGHPAELLLSTFIPKKVGIPKRRIRYIEIGEKAGSHISLPASAFRTSGVELMGIGKIGFELLVVEMQQVWTWIREDKLFMDIERVPLNDIASAWQRNDLAGKRLVIIP